MVDNTGTKSSILQWFAILIWCWTFAWMQN